MEAESVKNITSRSMPTPRPAVGRHAVLERAHVVGVVVNIASSSPLSLRATWARKRAACSSGSLSSEKPLAISRPPMKNSKRSVMKGSASFGAR